MNRPWVGELEPAESSDGLGAAAGPGATPPTVSGVTGSAEMPPGLEFVVPRPLLLRAPVIWFPISAGDRVLVAAGEAVQPGAPLAERVRDARLVDAPVQPAGSGHAPGDWLEGEGSTEGLGVLRRRAARDGELIHRAVGGWRVTTGDNREPLEAPTAGIVREVRSGVGIALGIAGAGLPGVLAIGGPARGRLEIAAGPEGELRPAAIDVGRAGSILVVGSRVDAETLTRARAMGLRGIVVAGLPGKELRDFAASEARQRASLHRLAPFAVLVLDGFLRRPIASPVMAVLAALAGREVAIVADPPLVLFDTPDTPLAPPLPGAVRVRHGPLAGREGRWAGLAGLRRFPSGIHLEAGLVRFDEQRPVALPLSDLERFE